jgi:hypothetical protein
VAAKVAACELDHPCETHACVHCAETKAAELREEAISKLTGMERALKLHCVLRVGNLGFPLAWTWTIRGLKYLYDWQRARGLACFGVIFADVSDATMHTELVLKVDRRLDLSELEKKWSQFTFGRGHVHSFERFDTIDPRRLALELVQARRWCPTPGTAAPAVLRALWIAGSRRRWDVSWRVVA